MQETYQGPGVHKVGGELVCCLEWKLTQVLFLVKEKWKQSMVASANFILLLTLLTPSFTPSSHTYVSYSELISQKM